MENISFEVEWKRPQSNGILTTHRISAMCISLDDAMITRKVAEISVPVTSDVTDYKYTLAGLQQYSACTIFLAGETRAGVGEYVNCSDSTPFTSITSF